MMESTTTRMGHSKSIATEDALYESSSSESENHDPKLYITVERSPYSIDGDDFDVESNDDTLITSSTVPKPIQYVESDNESTMDQISSGNTLVSNSIAPDIIKNDDLDEMNNKSNDATNSRGNNDIVFCPFESELNNRHKIEWKQEIIGRSKSLHDPVISSVNLNQSFTPGMRSTQGKLNLQKWVSETNRQKSPDRNKLNSPKRLDLSKWERNLGLNDKTMSDVSKPNQHATKTISNSATTQQSPNKTILMDKIDRLKQQIKKIESEASLVTTKCIAYVKPAELVITPDSSTDFATSRALLQDSTNDDCIQKSKYSNETVSNDYNDSNQCASVKTLRESDVQVYDMSSCRTVTSMGNVDGKCMKDTCTNIRIDDNNRNQMYSNTIKALHTYGSKESLNVYINEKIQDFEISSNCKDSSKAPIYECVSVDDDFPEHTSGLESTTTTNKSFHTEHNNELINSSASASSKVVETRIEKQSQGYKRQESLDSVMMQYSVSTTDGDPRFDQTCDESTLLYGDFESTTIHQTANCQILNGDDNTVDMNVSNTASIDQNVVTQDYDEVTVESLDTDDVSGSESSREIFLTSIETTIQLHQTDYECHGSIGQKNSKCTLVNEKPKPKRCHNDVPVDLPTSDYDKNQLFRNVGLSNIMNDTNLRISDVLRNPADTTDQIFDATAFIKHLNLDPWNKDVKLDDQQIINMIESNPALCSQKYSFEGFHGSVYPLSAMCALGATVPMIKKCYLAFPDAIKKADAWVGTSLHYACSYHASFQVVEYLAKKNPSALKAANQFNRFPLHM
jgi:hypothetical protein